MAPAKTEPSTVGLVEKSYVSRVQDLLPSPSTSSATTLLTVDLLELLRQPDKNTTRIYVANGDLQQELGTPADLVAFAAANIGSERGTICVIENISARVIEELGSAWDLDPEFFIGHATNLNKTDLWVNHPGDYVMREYQHLDGVFEYHGMRGQKDLNSSPNYFPRHCFEETPYPVQSSTRISYYRVPQGLYKGLYLFLVDAPLDIMMKHLKLYPMKRATLRLTYATNRGGLILPQSFSLAKYSLFESLKAFLQHQWHFRILFDGDDGAIPGQPLVYTLSNSLWELNLRHLTADIHRISFEQVRSPTLQMNDDLHDLRRNLAFLKSSLTETINFAPSTVVKYFDEHVYYVLNAPARWKSANPIESHQRVLDAAGRLEMFLMETFQLLMSSISVRDSQLSIEQSQRTTRLTLLAFVYVPLSFITGIFGMNVQDINGTGLPIWVCFVALAIIVVLTAGIFWFLHARGKKKKARGDRTQV